MNDTDFAILLRRLDRAASLVFTVHGDLSSSTVIREAWDALSTIRAELADEQAFTDRVIETLRFCATDIVSVAGINWRLRYVQPLVRATLTEYEARRTDGNDG